MVPEIKDAPWDAVFEAATKNIQANDVANSRFGRQQVADVLGVSEGVRCGPPWTCFGELKDGRFFYIYADADVDDSFFGEATVAAHVDSLDIPESVMARMRGIIEDTDDEDDDDFDYDADYDSVYPGPKKDDNNDAPS